MKRLLDRRFKVKASVARAWAHLVGLFGRIFAAVYARSLDRAIPNLIKEIDRQ